MRLAHRPGKRRPGPERSGGPGPAPLHGAGLLKSKIKTGMDSEISHLRARAGYATTKGTFRRFPPAWRVAGKVYGTSHQGIMTMEAMDERSHPTPKASPPARYS